MNEYETEFLEYDIDKNPRFILLKPWKTPTDEIRLSLLILKDSNESRYYFLNRRRKKYGWKWERGVEIPIDLAWKIGGKLLDRPKELPVGEIESYGDWDFMPIYSWPVSQYKKINLKRMKNRITGEEKYFLNRQDGSINEGGVEIPKYYAFSIGETLFKVSRD